MEVTSHTFYPSLSEMLKNIVGCCFVAIDLEFSSAPGTTEVRNVTPLQQRYKEIRKAAQEYSVIQLGITIVRKDYASDRYVAYPYNLCLNPLLPERLAIDRRLTFQDRALSFLLRHGFNLQGLVQNGVPYLSRREADKARQRGVESYSGTAIPDIILREDETDLREFMDRARRKIHRWYTSDPRTSELLLSHEAYIVTRAPHTGLSRLEQRLARQIIRNEFDDLDARRCDGGLIVKKANKELSKVHQNRVAAATEETIQKQTGARWIIEGLCGAQTLQQADATKFIELASSRPVLIDTNKAASDFSDLCKALRETRPVIVGHNLFVDLVYLYATFFDHPPEQAQDFFQLIHSIFPRIVDTKYLATAKNVQRRLSSLQDICEQYATQILPPFDITDDPSFNRYSASAHPHEAGYDSLMTARVAVKLAAHLACFEGYVSQADQCAPSSPKSENSDLIDFGSPKPVGEGEATTASTQTSSQVGQSASSGHVINQNFVMPDWESAFWTAYGNRLRVYGTVEREVYLGTFEKRLH